MLLVYTFYTFLYSGQKSNQVKSPFASVQFYSKIKSSAYTEGININLAQ